MKAVNGVKLELSQFRIFGCTFYIHILVEKMTKLKPSNMKGLFFLLQWDFEGLQGLYLRLGNIVVSKHVNFDEYFASMKTCDPTSTIEDEEW